MKKTSLAVYGGLLLFTLPSSLYPSADNDSPPVILLDAGHGTLNFDGDIINSGKYSRDKTPEHTLTLQLVLATGICLKSQGFQVYYTRSPDRYWRQGYNPVDDNKARALLAKKVGANAIVSFHCDWDPRSHINGLSTLYGKKNSRGLGTMVHQQLIHDLKMKDRKLKHDQYTLFDFAEMPAIIIETGFLSNPSDAKKLRDPDFQQRVAKGTETALRKYFNF